MKTNIYVPLITPFNKDFSVDYDGLARATKFVLDKGVDGIYAVGGSSEFTLLTTEEKKKCLETIIKAADGAEVIAHVGSTSTLESLELARFAAKAGASQLSAVAPFYYGYNFAAVKEYFRAISHETELPLIIYNASQGRTYTVAEMSELLQDEKVSGMKYTNTNFFALERLVQAFPNKKFYTGSDENFVSGQAVGAQGAIGTTYNFQGEKFVEMKKLMQANDVAGALKLQHEVNYLTELYFETGSSLALTKYYMVLGGLDILPISRPPFLPLSEEIKTEAKRRFENNK